MADVTMPKLSDTMEEGKILRWLKQAGDRVEVGDLLLEVETDKADMEVEASDAGVLREVKLGEGETAAVGAVIAVIDGAGDGAAPTAKGDDGARAKETPAKEAPAKADSAKGSAEKGARAKEREAPPEGKAKGEVEAPDEPAEATPQAQPATRKEPASEKTAAPESGTAAAASSRPAPAASTAPTRSAQGPKSSPLARARAEELGVDLATVRGTGPAGRITRRDVEDAAGRSDGKAAEKAPAPERPAAAARTDATPTRSPERPARAPEAPEAAAGARRVPLSKMRASIAKRMTESKREAPHFYLTTVVDMEEAVRLRAQLKTLEVSRVGVTYNHMVLKAVADALVEFPEVNARFAGDAIEIDPAINLGIATAVDDGLIVPVLAGADRLSLLEIAEQARALADKAESGRFTSADLSGATFSVSNLGMFDVDSFSAVINPPQAAILAVGSVKQRPVVRDGALAVGHTMALTLSCDHRVIDGARGGRFLADVKRRLENPAALLLGSEAGA